MKAVITGDVKNSSIEFKNKQKLLLKNLNSVYKKVQSFYPQQLPYSIDIFRGDSFQFFIDDILDCVRIMLVFWLYSKSQEMEVKLGLGIGNVDFLKKTKISESNGDAFMLSGKALENLSPKSFLKVEVSSPIENDYIDAYINLVDLYLKNLSEKNALAAFGKMVAMKQEDIIKLWDGDISQQSISKHWKNMAIDEFISSLDKFSAYLTNMTNNTTL